MSREDHPAFYQSCCGAPFVRTLPSGRTQHFHRWTCPVSPNEVIDPVVPHRRAEIANHAARPHNWNRCRIPECPECAEIDVRMDEAYEQEGRR